MDEWTQTGIFSRSSWPLPNVWLGVSIENRRFIHRADSLRETPAAVRFISAEPLLGPLIARSEDGMRYWDDWWDGPELDLTAIDWLIVGGESGRGHRPIKEQWVTDLRDAAAQHGAAFFFKQWGGLTPKAGGRELDGRTWDEMPPSALAVDQIKEVV
jgi:protein gp37